MQRTVAIAAALGASLATDAAYAMSLSFSWDGVRACGSSPPAFQLADVPAGTTKLAFAMVDLNVPSFHHGGGTVAYQGGDTIPAGSFSYTGPCPPSGQHRYRWTVRALDARGKPLATATATEAFPPQK
jgi:phosphatidylethanolamine-binding protein (PEBP) family uncharacterized protein